jgi:hypothetical protein
MHSYGFDKHLRGITDFWQARTLLRVGRIHKHHTDYLLWEV